MFLKFIVTCFLFTSAIDGNQLDYKFSDEADGWLKLYKDPMTWNDAKIRCDAEGSVLVSPLAIQLRDGIKKHLLRVNETVSTIYTGVHAEYTDGDFLSIEGVRISSLSVPLLPSASIDYTSSESCIAWDTTYDKLRKVNCESKFPYVCYKKRKTAQLPTVDTGVGTSGSESETGKQHTLPGSQTQPEYGAQPDRRTQQSQPTQPDQRYQPVQQPQPPHGAQPDQRRQQNYPTQPDQRYQPAQQPQPSYGVQPNQPTQQNYPTQPDQRYQPAQQPQPPRGAQPNQRIQQNQPTQPSQRPLTNQWTQPGQGYQPAQQPQPQYGAQTEQWAQSSPRMQPDQRTQTNQRTSPTQRPYDKCTVDGSNLIIINSDLQSAVLRNLANYPAVTVIFADTAYIQSNDGSSSRVVVQKKQNQNQGVSDEGSLFGVPLSAQGFSNSAESRIYRPSSSGVLTTTPRPQTLVQPYHRRRAILSYSLDRQTGFWLKMHQPDTWNAALNRCASEGAVLASPLTTTLNNAIKAYVQRVNPLISRIYTGVHANFSNDFYSTEGFSLTQMPVSLDSSTNIYDNTEKCIVLNTFNTAVNSVRCTERYPYVCLKKRTLVRGCGVRIPGYTYDPRTESCYKFQNHGRSWSDAYNTCKTEGGYLAVINSHREYVVLKELFTMNPARTISNYNSPDRLYIGRRGWLDDQSSVTVKDESIPKSNGNETCSTLNRDGFIYDDPCDLYLAFVCEKDSEMLDINPNNDSP